MCFSSGGGGAAAQAQASADQQKQEMQQAMAAINTAFNSPSRQQQYTTYQNDVQGKLDTELQKQFQQQQRDTKFSIARQGLTGGSADADLNGQLGKDYAAGLTGNASSATQAAASLRQADIQAKNNLDALAQSGLTAGDAATAANSSLGANLQAAEGNIPVAGVGSVFDNLATAYNNSQQIAGQRAAMLNPYGSLFGGTSIPSSGAGAAPAWLGG